MKKIPRLSLTHMRNIEFSGFSEQVQTHLQDCPSIAESDEGKAFTAALGNYKVALVVEQGVSFRDVQHVHKLTLQTWSSLMSQAKLVKNFGDPEIDAKSDEVISILNRRGNPSKKPYNDAYAIIQEQLNQLEALPAATLSAIYCHRWVQLLRQRYNDFIVMQARFVRDNSAQPVGSVKESRTVLEAAYHALCEYVMAASTFVKTDDVLTLNSAIAQLVETKRLTTKQKKGRDKDEPEEKEPPEESIEKTEEETPAEETLE